MGLGPKNSRFIIIEAVAKMIIFGVFGRCNINKPPDNSNYDDCNKIEPFFVIELCSRCLRPSFGPLAQQAQW